MPCSHAEFLHQICKLYVSRLFKGFSRVLNDPQSECSSKFNEFQVLCSHWQLLNAIFTDLSVFWYWCTFWSRVIGSCYYRCNSIVFMFGCKKPRHLSAFETLDDWSSIHFWGRRGCGSVFLYFRVGTFGHEQLNQSDGSKPRIKELLVDRILFFSFLDKRLGV